MKLEIKNSSNEQTDDNLVPAVEDDQRCASNNKSRNNDSDRDVYVGDSLHCRTCDAQNESVTIDWH